MKKNLLTASVLSVLMMSGSVWAQGNASIEQCAKLLPSDGKHYALSLTGQIKEDRHFEGILNIGDNTQQPLTDAEKKAAEPFLACVKKLIK